MTPIARIGFLLSEMNEAEQSVLLYVAERLHKGRTEYGPLNPHDGRDWREEMAQELADALVYHAIDATAKEARW